MAQLVIHQTDKKRSSSSVNGSQGSASTNLADIEAEHLPVEMSGDFPAVISTSTTSELAAIQTLARVYCEKHTTAKVTVHPRRLSSSRTTCSSTVTDL